MKSVKNLSILLLFFAFVQTSNAAGWVRHDPGTLAWLRAIYFANQNKGWIGGSKGTFLKTEDGGRTWRQAENFTQDNIRDIYFVDEMTGYLLCERDVYNSGSSPLSYLLKTSNGGKSWEKIDFTSGRERIAKIFFADGGYGYAVGETGTFFMMQEDKKTWKRIVLPTRALMLDGNFSDDWHGLLVGGGGTILFTEDAGMTWNPATLAGNGKTKLNSVFFINPKTGWAAGAQGKIYATMNGGKYWREQNSTVTQNISDVFFINTGEGFAVGDEGTILHTTTAGNVWTAQQPVVSHKLERVFYNGHRVFAVGFGGTILSYEKTSLTNDKMQSKPQLQKRN
jgi:photosystem II stability/assembly factor-like uncharacterized protein